MKLHNKKEYRIKRFSYFIRLFNINSSCKILDVGGDYSTWEGSGLEKNVTINNVYLPKDLRKYPKWIKGDACNMSMLNDESYDIVFSNSVIEHVGDSNKQHFMSKEIRRIGKKYWVQTPNKYFPIEIHFLFPFLNLIPRPLQTYIVKYWPFSFAKKLKLDPIHELNNLYPLSFADMKNYFPDANIVKEKFLFLTKSIIAYKNE